MLDDKELSEYGFKAGERKKLVKEIAQLNPNQHQQPQPQPQPQLQRQQIKHETNSKCTAHSF